MSEKPTTYYSASKRKTFLISDRGTFNEFHLANSIAKTKREVEAGDDSKQPLLDALQQEAEIRSREATKA